MPDEEDLHAQLAWALDHLNQPRDRAEASAALAELALEASMEARVGPALLALIEDPEAEVRAAACAGLARCKRPEELPGLLGPMLADTDVHVRREAARSLASLEDADLRPLLLRSLHDDDPQVRFEAAVGLAALHDPAGLTILSESTRDRIRRFGALGALARLKHPEGRTLAHAVLGKVWVSDFDRTQAAGLLAALGEPVGKQYLLDRLERRRADDRGLAMELCGEHGVAEATESLVRAVQDGRDPFQGAAARSLGLLGAHTARPLLCSLSENEQARIEARCDALEGLMFLRSPESRADLEALGISARQPEIREAVREALAWLDRNPAGGIGQEPEHT